MWYSHLPKSITENEDIAVLWNQGVERDREAVGNMPDVIVKNNRDGTCLLIYVRYEGNSKSKIILFPLKGFLH
jgi:hypothetical protein